MPPEFTDEDAMAWCWTLWADSGHSQCPGWMFEHQRLTCSCGDVLWELAQVPA
jgi:hypothetical protein